MTVTALANRLPLSPEAIAQGLVVAKVPGRIQIIPGPVEWILDVAHNVQGAVALAQCLEGRPCTGRTRGVLGVLGDKDAGGLARAMDPVVDHWYAAGLGGSRGRRGEALAVELGKAGIRSVLPCADVVAAIECVRREAAPGDRCIVFGSFHTVVEALKFGLC
jgi:dihydrofolate synthase/folylpolyglutamate synthase